jgi:gamma-glutamyltranspeptidase/glutathione hydrolase
VSVQPEYRARIRATRHMAAAGHYLAAQAAFQILEAGGNAVDAGVGGAITLSVVHSDFVGAAGVAPMMIYLAGSEEITTIDGLGTWPKRATIELFQTRYGGRLPLGIMRTVVPGAPDAWITALEMYGSLSFGEVAQAAIRFARDGFPATEFFSATIDEHAQDIRRWPSSARIFLPDGLPPKPGILFFQRDLGRTLQYLADEEKAVAKRGRVAGLKAARKAFYEDDIAVAIVKHQQENGGLLTADDLAAYKVTVEPPVKTTFGDIEVYSCGPWCQGPMLLQALNILERMNVKADVHNGTRYIHHVAEALKLCFSDRHAYYGDPKFVQVPMGKLLSKAYAEERCRMIHEDRAWPGMPPPGSLASSGQSNWGRCIRAGGDSEQRRGQTDTSYICVIDSWGNVFSATPSDGSTETPVVPGTGLCVSPRGLQSWTDPAVPSCMAPGKRPRLTPNPAIAMRRGEFRMPFGTPGGDIQVQAMLQVFLNITVYSMDPQQAVDAPRFATESFPSSMEPHVCHPGLLNLEARIAAEAGQELDALGHRVEWWKEWDQRAGGVCTIIYDERTGVMEGAADPRRPGGVAGW